jgi:hypothetical protein
MKKLLSIGCGDWHLGWGFAGDDKIGKLFLNDDGTYTWKGHRQGRHGQIIKSKYSRTFNWDGEKPIGDDISHLPAYSEVQKAIETLTIMKEAA